MNIRGAGWQADCPQCVGSKFTCDAHFHRIEAADQMARKLNIGVMQALACMDRGAELAAALDTAAASERRAAVGNGENGRG